MEILYIFIILAKRSIFSLSSKKICKLIKNCTNCRENLLEDCLLLRICSISILNSFKTLILLSKFINSFSNSISWSINCIMFNFRKERFSFLNRSRNRIRFIASSRSINSRLSIFIYFSI